MAAADDPSEKQSESESKQFSEAARSLPLPPPVLHHLLSTGVCPRCIFRLFGVRGSVYSLSSLTASTFSSLINASLENENDGLCCNVCLGILEFGSCGIDGFVKGVGQVIEKEGHQIDGFCLEISVPPVISANERAFWIDMKKKYGSAEWFKDKHIWEQITVKEALRLSITSSLESHLDVKSAINTFSLRFTYSHLESSAELQQSFGNDHGSKRRKTGAEAKDALVDSNGRSKKDSNGKLHTESDAAILRVINNLQDDAFHEKFVLPHQKVFKPCHLEITCQKMPMYIAGRYLKFSRKVSQSRWIIDDERMGEASVEEIVGSNALSVCKGDSYKFHAAGREDIDVRMLGSGRPFLIEVLNARCLPPVVDIQLIEDTINRENKQYVRVRKLKLVGTEIWNLMREGEAEKQKQYAAVVWISNPLTKENCSYISSVKDMEISQKTPIRVLHRRSPLERKRVIHWMKVEKIHDSSQYFLLHLCTQAGTYIKEFVHGDLGRTYPSIGSILGCRAEILQLDVTDVKMDSFD